MLDLAGPTVADLLDVRVDSAAFQGGEGEFASDENEGACGQCGEPEQTPQWGQEVPYVA
jgi:hypothetical protein